MSASGSAADAIIVGSGPNGLAARDHAGPGRACKVHLIEGAATPGGGCRTEELTLPGFRHDVCSAVHPLAGVLAVLPRASTWRRTVSGCVRRRWRSPTRWTAAGPPP